MGGRVQLYELAASSDHVEVGVRSKLHVASRPADTVTLVDAMPEGMAIVAVVEEPDEGGECR